MKNITKTMITAAAIALMAHQASAQTVIYALPFVISTAGNYILEGNLTLPPGTAAQNAITVNTNNVTIDLGGFEISQTASPSTSIDFGIFAMNRANITVKNGTIVGFNEGIVLEYTSGLNINYNHVIDGVRFLNEQLFAIVLHHATNCLVQNCAIADTGYGAKGNVVSALGTGIDVSLTSQGAGNALVNNRITHSTLLAAESFGGTYLNANFASQCPTGFKISANDKYRNNTTIDCVKPFVPNGATDLGGNN
jgi:hypothetical protein